MSFPINIPEMLATVKYIETAMEMIPLDQLAMVNQMINMLIKVKSNKMTKNQRKSVAM